MQPGDRGRWSHGALLRSLDEEATKRGILARSTTASIAGGRARPRPMRLAPTS